MKTIISILMSLFLGITTLQAQISDIWTRFTTNPIEMEPFTTGYVNSKGDTVISLGKYVYCFTEKFDKIAIVLTKKLGDNENHYYAIDKKENILFEVASWDILPDEVCDGLFRIIVDGKMGFANMDGKIVIKPIYTMTRPFSEGYAPFCVGGHTVSDGLHNWVEGAKWGLLDKTGKIVVPAQFDQTFGLFKDGKITVEQNGVTFKIDKNGNKVE